MGPPLQHESQQHRDAATKIVRTLQAAGHVAYFAGGCVRDQIMGREPSDFDVATGAPPEKVVKIFPVAKRVGEAFGVVVVKSLGVWVEVATFRAESHYSDGRHPDQVTFTDAEHDALRRDFTINGLFYDPVADRVIDYVGGREDIERKVLRAIGDPQARFAEDYLRMLRAVRFASRFGFAIDPPTAAAIKPHAPKLKAISRERIGIEVETMMASSHRASAARLLHALGLDAPTLNEPTIETTDREPVCLAKLPSEAHPVTGLAAYAIDRHMEPRRPEGRVQMVDALDRIKAVQIARGWRRALVLSNDHTELLQALLLGAPRVVMWPELDVAQRKRLLVRPEWPHLRQLFEAVVEEEKWFDGGAWDAEVKALEAEGVSPTPLITGDDLVAAGFDPGPRFKHALEKVYDAQLAGLVATKEQAMAMARQLVA